MMISNFKTLKNNLKKDISYLPAVKVALLGDTATQFLATAIKGVAVQRGLNIEMFEADYSQVERQLLDTTSELYEFNADYIVVFHSSHKLLSTYNKLPVEKQHLLAASRLDFVSSLSKMVKSRIIYFNYPEIDDSVYGSYSNKVESSFTYQIRKLNYQLMDISIKNTNLFICDVAAIQNKVGRDVMFHPAVYIGSEMVFSIDVLPYIAGRTMDIICAVEGKFKKCLILDLDNTVWGGIVGDDGYEKLELGHELGIGKAFTEFQEWALKLKNRGIILAVCSKNNEDTAKEPFEKHPEMVLRLKDIAVFIANWENKADNIRRIQSILNIGFDSIVFLDDNPFERNMVRENLPDVTVPELPEDPAQYLEYLYSLNLFETATHSHTDAERTKHYQVEAERAATQTSFANEADFLQSLDMKSEVTPFNSFNTPRVSQLSQRSNQFNLRTVRYTEAEVELMSKDEDSHTFSFTLTDKFGDNGLICVVILKKKDDETAFIDTWFMSCRVLKRGMENFTLNTIVEYARGKGFKNIMGEYIPTSKNSMVQNHYTQLGFIEVDDPEHNYFNLDVDKYEKKESYITAI